MRIQVRQQRPLPTGFLPPVMNDTYETDDLTATREPQTFPSCHFKTYRCLPESDVLPNSPRFNGLPQRHRRKHQDTIHLQECLWESAEAL